MQRKSSLWLVLILCLAVLTACGAPAPAAPPPSEMPQEQSVEPSATPIPSPTPELLAPTATSTPTITPIPPPTQNPNQVNRLPPGEPLTLSVIDMQTETQGWAVGSGVNDLNGHILYTHDAAATWQDLTPPEPVDPAGGLIKLAVPFFLDETHAWVIFGNMDRAPQSAPQQVWYTTDAGQSWTASAPLEPVQGGDFFAPDTFSFSDAQHGWLLVHVGAGMSHDYVFIFSTSDGGKNWQRIVDPQLDNLAMSCGKTGMVFATAQKGFVSGDCFGVVTASVYFYQTLDAGATWNPVTLPAPADSPNLFTDQENGCGGYDPAFANPSTGWLVVKCNHYDVIHAVNWLYSTTNGGQSWTPYSLPAVVNSIQFLDARQGWMIGGKSIYATQDGGKSWKELAKLNWTGQPNFATAKTGWVIAKAGVSLALVKSIDGGVTWAEITPVLK